MKTIRHPPFLAEMIAHLNKSNSVAKRLLVFPNQLSIDYFESLGSRVGQDNCLTLHQLMLENSRLTLLPTLTLLRRLHRFAEEILDIKKSFDEFYSWGLTLLEDFNTIDSHLVNGVELFASLMEQKQLTSDSLLDQGPLASLKKARGLSLFQQQETQLFWKQLPLLYESFRAALIEAGEGYEGLCYRMAHPAVMAQELVFVGFNLLTPSEEQFIKQCQKDTSVIFFWDGDAHYVDNSNNIAGHYLRQHKKWFQNGFPIGNYLNDPDKKAVLTEASTTVAQVQAVIAALQEKTNDGKPRFLPGQTAIVVSGSELLIPLLDHLSNLSIPLHCRLDYPFNVTVIYTIAERLVALWQATVSEPQSMYGHMAVLLALWAPFAQTALQSQITAMRESLNERKVDHLFDLWFNKDHQALLPYLQKVLNYVSNHFTDHLFLGLNKTALNHLLVYIEGLMAEMADCSIAVFLSGLKQSRMLFHKANPLTGLYIIEVTESYNLDFENLFFLNMNEGCFPKGPRSNSFLPYDLSYRFGLPLVDRVAEAKTAYGFYRLLQRAQNIYCYYVQQNQLNTSEMSRLLLQLTFDSKLQVRSSYHSIHLSEKPIAPIVIQKDHAVMALLAKFTGSSLTPSALITYLSCPLQFYFNYLLQLKQTVVPKEAAEAVQLGTLFHDVMARLYRPFVGMQLDKGMAMELKSKIKREIAKAIAASHTPLSTPMLLHALLEKLLGAMLELDGADAPFTLSGVEVAIQQSMVLDAQRKVSLRGVIDRIDRQNDLIRIVDYKTGLSNCKISHITALFDPTKIKKHKAVFQLFFYAWLFQSLHGADRPQPIMPYLIHIREIFLKDYRPGIFIQQSDGKKYQRIDEMTAYAQPFEEGLKGLLVEIFNPAIPFVQTADREICSHCPYARICQRD